MHDEGSSIFIKFLNHTGFSLRVENQYDTFLMEIELKKQRSRHTKSNGEEQFISK